MRLYALALCLFASMPAFGYGGRQIPGTVRPPIGWIQYCDDQPAECYVPALPPQDAKMTAAKLSGLSRFNRDINGEIIPRTDMDHWGVIEKWSQPTDGSGDCEDYALLKRKQLIEGGWPRQALLITVVLDANGGGHTVLTVVTDRGELILDSLRDEIRSPSQTGYRFVKRQSREHPNVWVGLEGSMAATSSAR